MSYKRKNNRGKKSRKKNILPKLVMFFIFGVIIINILNDNDSSQQSGQSGGQQNNSVPVSAKSDTFEHVSELVPSAALYALQPLKDSWPMASNNENDLSVQSELLTKNYYIVLDGSGSMRKAECSDGRQKIDVAIEALQVFAGSLPGDSNFGLAVFRNDQIKEVIPLGRVQQGVRIPTFKPEGSTPLKSSIGFAYERITRQAKKQLGYGEYNLVVITDGEASEGQNPVQVVNAILQESPVILQTIGFCIGVNHVLNQPGRSAYKAANNSAELQRGLKDITAESPDFRVDSF